MTTPRTVPDHLPESIYQPPRSTFRLCPRCQTVHDGTSPHQCWAGYHHSHPPSVAAAAAFLGLLVTFLALVGAVVWLVLWIWGMVA